MKKLSAVLFCVVVVLCFSGCDLNPLVNILNGNAAKVESYVEGTVLEDGTTLYYQDKVSDAVSIEFKDENGKVWLDNADIVKVSAKFDDIYRYYIELELTENGSTKFSEATKENIGKTITISADGVAISSPTVEAEITTKTAIISNIIGQQELFDLFNTLT